VVIHDWRGVPADALAPLFERERRDWLSTLRWDPARAHSQIELARTTWGLPGLVAVDEARLVRGLVYFLESGGRLEIGGMIADRPAVTGALLDGVLACASEDRVPDIFCFVYANAPGLGRELTRRGFDLDPFIYFDRSLERTAAASLDLAADPPMTTCAWRMDDLDAAAALLQRAFEPREGAHFAPGHTLQAWQRYLRNLVEYGGCGVLNARASRCVRFDNGLGAMTLVTTIATDTAHVVQVAVDPACRGRRLAAALVRESCRVARDQGMRAMTLMAARRNARARELYADLGFSERATFLAATRAQPLRLTSAAADNGGETTLR
jgi:ribosomal protein S18 acetylase RimI-like enzyme